MKLTVLGAVVVTFNMPAVMVNTPATPRLELAVNCNEVPFTVVLKRFAVPLKLDVPVKVAVPAVADKLPLTARAEETEKLALVVTEPGMDNVLKLMVPVPDIVFEAPIIAKIVAPEVKLPLTVKLPMMAKADEVLTVPLIVRLSGEIPEPLIVVPVPDIKIVPPES